MITGVSLARMELISSDPMPGMRKICSVTIGASEHGRHRQRYQRSRPGSARCGRRA